MQESHNSISALTIHCIDYRFVGKQRDFFVNEGLNKNYDLIAYPGASKDIGQLLPAIDVSVRLHKPTRIMILDHEDCGAFGDNNTFANHEASLKNAKKVLNEKYPQIKVELFLTKFTGVEKI